MKLISTLFFIFFFSYCSFAQIPTGYYSTASGLSGTLLRQALHDKIDNHSVQSYSSLLTHYNLTDKKPNGKVWDMYSDNPGGIPPYEFTFGNTCGNYSVEGDCYNREHSWPQSWFNSTNIPRNDLFHVYPTDGKVNGLRDNFPYGEVFVPTTTTLNGGKLGPCTFPGYAGTVFEPINEYKGDFARTYFYMCTRYFGEDAGWQNTPATNGANLDPWQLDLLKKWAQQDPVSTKEINRNNAVFLIQNNRNPFIDSPQFVCRIWPGAYCGAVATSIATNIGTVQNLCSGNQITVNFLINGSVNTGNIFSVQLSDAAGSFTNATTIGTLLSVTSSPIAATIPTNLPAGTAYRIRVNSSNPLIIGTDNGINLTEASNFIVSAGNDVTICANQSVTLSATGANQYIWNNTATTSSILVSPLTTTAYVVSGLATGGCVDFDTVLVTVNPAPITPLITLNGTIITSNNPDFQSWYLNGQEIQGENSQTLSLFQTGLYYSIVNGANGCNSQQSNVINYKVSGISNLSADLFKVYPNPSYGNFVVETNSNIAITNIEVINMLGQKVFVLQNKAALDNMILIDINNQAAGIYHLILETDKGISIQKLMVK